MGLTSPAGCTVGYPVALGWVAVTFSTTAPAPDAGTLPRPATVSVRVLPGPTAPPPAASASAVEPPARVSSSRAGGTAL